MKTLITYKTIDGKCPYENWLYELDTPIRARIEKRMERVQEGNLGDWKKIDNDISELRLCFGSGYRIYFSEYKDTIIILLSGGNKSSQSRDIKKAKEYYNDLIERSINEN